MNGSNCQGFCTTKHNITVTSALPHACCYPAKKRGSAEDTEAQILSKNLEPAQLPTHYPLPPHAAAAAVAQAAAAAAMPQL